MLRSLHRWPGLIAALLAIVLALGGAALSVFPALEHLGAPQAAGNLTVAELAARVSADHPGLEQIRRAPSGRVVAYWFDGGQPGSALIDPATITHADWVRAPSPARRRSRHGRPEGARDDSRVASLTPAMTEIPALDAPSRTCQPCP